MCDDRCPACDEVIDPYDLVVFDEEADDLGRVLVPFICPHCGTELTAYYNVEGGYVEHFEV